MLTWVGVFRGLGIAVLIIIGIETMLRVLTEEATGLRRRMEIVGALEKFKRWADQNKYRIVIREPASDHPFPRLDGAPLVLRVVVLDQEGVTRSGWVRCGGRLDVRWAEPHATITPSSAAF